MLHQLNVFFSGISVVMKSDVSVFCYILVKKKKKTQPRLDMADKQRNESCGHESEDIFVCVYPARTPIRKSFHFHAAVAHEDISANHKTTVESFRSKSWGDKKAFALGF